MKKIHPEYYFSLCLLVLAVSIAVIGAVRDSFADGVIATLLMWWADNERKKAADAIEKTQNEEIKGPP